MLAACAIAAGCAASLPAESPPPGAQLYFPGPFLAMPDGASAYVVSTNFDQRYDAGWLTRIDLARLGAALDANGPISGALTKALAVPSMASDATFSGTNSRGYISHRGSGYVTVLDTDVQSGTQQLHCGSKGGAGSLGGYLARTDCDIAHLYDVKSEVARREGILHRPEREQLDDPIALTTSADGSPQVAFASDERVVQLAGDQQGLAIGAIRKGPGEAAFGSLLSLADGSVCGLGQRQGGTLSGRQESLLRVWPPGNAAAIDVYPSRELSDGRALDRTAAALLRAAAAPAPDGRLFALSQGPDALLALRPRPRASSQVDDVGAVVASDAATGYELADAYPLPGATLTDIAVIPRDGGNLVVVSSLERDALYFFDASSARLQLVRRLRLSDGRGPNRLLVTTAGARSVLLVSTFYDHGLAVVDLSPSSATDFVAKSFHDELFENALARP